LVAVAFALRTRLGRPLLRDWLRALLALALLGVIAYQSVRLRPAMNSELFAFIDAATLGDAPSADFHREQFSALHPTASRTLSAVFLLTFASLAAGVWGRRDG